jgi:hypothetical protein
VAEQMASGVGPDRIDLAGDFSSVAYALEDMAADTIGLLDALGIERARR